MKYMILFVAFIGLAKAASLAKNLKCFEDYECDQGWCCSHFPGLDGDCVPCGKLEQPGNLKCFEDYECDQGWCCSHFPGLDGDCVPCGKLNQPFQPANLVQDMVGKIVKQDGENGTTFE